MSSMTFAALFVRFHFLEHWNSCSDDGGSGVTFATFVRWSAIWVLAHQFTLWLRALWLGTFPIAFWFIADSFAKWFWDLN